MRSGKQKGVLIPAVLVSLVCTVALSAFCMFIQVGMTMQAQDEDIRECMDAVMEAVSEVSGNYDQNIATFDEVYRAKAATAARAAKARTGVRAVRSARSRSVKNSARTTNRRSSDPARHPDREEGPSFRRVLFLYIMQNKLSESIAKTIINKYLAT